MTLDPSTTMPANEREKLACDGSVGQGWAPVRHNLHLFLSCSTAYDNGRPFLFSFGRPLSGCENKRKRRELCLVGKKAFLLLRCFLSCERPEVTRRLSSLDKGLTWRCLTALPFDGIESRGLTFMTLVTWAPQQNGFMMALSPCHGSSFLSFILDEPTWRCHQNPFVGALGTTNRNQPWLDR
jgi:hypothetical protein